MEREEGVVVIGRAEIDTRQPFGSVKEAVMLFGERVLAGEIYANKLKQMQIETNEQGQSKAKLEETKQSLEKAKEEGLFMAYCLTSLKQELEETKRELQQLKSRRESVHEQQHPVLDYDPSIHEELKFIENESNEVRTTAEVDGVEYFQKKRSVKFANPPSLIITSKDIGEVVETNTTNNITKKKKRKPLIPLFGGLFSISKKKGGQ